MNRLVYGGIGILLLAVGIGPIHLVEIQEKATLSHSVAISKVSAQVTKPLQPAEPKRLIIPVLNVNAPIQSMGLDEGKMAVPNNFSDIGWYKYGTIPGNKGSAVMGAHVDNGGSVRGVFKYLKDVAPGDDIYVTDTEGTTRHFRVSDRKVYPYQTKITDEVFLQNDKVRLNLITCHGKFLPKENTYNQRLVVFAELVTS
ncbi:class F sortase [Candidatus Parcubacteria bacterium]|nr:class F sortase [Candidatus Parcubacteria bacterium]